jgi:hypothetical protein
MRRLRHGWTAVAVLIALLALALALRAPSEPTVIAAPLAGCGAHTTYLTACVVSGSSLNDALPGSDTTNYYKIAMPPEGQALQVQLSGAAGLHAALLRDESGVSGPALSSLAAARPQSETTDAGPPVPGETVSGAQPAETVGPFPAPFEDTPFEDTPFEDTPFEDTPFEDTATGARGNFPLQVLAIAADATPTKTLTHFSDALDAPELRKASIVLAVWSPSGAAGAYAVSLQTLAAQDTCQPDPSIVPALPTGFAATHRANSAAPDGAQTVILTDESMWARYYGLDGQARVMQQLDYLAQQPQVRGAVLAVDADRTVASAYDAWNADRCSATLANAVAARVKSLLQAYLTAHPSIHDVVLAGGDNILPFFRLPDPVRIANERQYVGQSGLLADSAGSSVYARGDLLTDDYYTDPRGALSGEQLLFTETTPLGRLVESPDDIAAAVKSFTTNNGALQAHSALVTGYDFLKETATTVGGVLGPSVDHLQQLNDDSWGGAQLAEALGAPAPGMANYQQADGSPDLVFFSGHFAHNALQTAQLDGFRTDALSGAGGLAGKVLFTLGCHGGASVADADSDPTTGISTQDWAQTVAGLGGLLIGNTGYGYGDSDVQAYGQELMTTLAQYLVTGSSNAPESVGDALLRAKKLYRARNSGKWDGYHDKTVMEATLFGLPMYGVAVPNPQAAPADPSLLDGTRSQFGKGMALHVELDAPGLTRVDTARGSYYLSADGVDIRAFQPVQPQMTYQLPEIRGMTPKGFVLDSASQQGDTNFDPVIVRPMWDVTEPEPQFLYGTPQPADLGTINTQTALDGAAQHNLVLNWGQFISTATIPAGDPADSNNPYVAGGVAYPHVVGMETIYTHLSFDIFYSPSNDQRPPAVVTSLVCTTANGLQIEAHARRPLSSLALLVSDGGTLQSTPLSSADGSNWAGGGSATGTFYLQAIDANGNAALTALDQPSGPCPNPTQVPQPGSPTVPPIKRPRGNVTISTIELGGLVARLPSAYLTGQWGTGGPRCDLPDSVWLLDYYVTGPNGVLDPNAQPSAPAAAAPCDRSGQPLTWTATVSLATASPTSNICVALYFGPVSSPGRADAYDCRPVPQNTAPTGVQTLTVPTPRPIQPTPQPPTPSPNSNCFLLAQCNPAPRS